MNRVREWWDSLGRNNQIILVASSVGILVALIGFIAWAGTPEYVPLFSDLSAQNANAVSDKLKEANVPFRLIQNGTGIEVPAPQRDELRIKMAAQIPDLTAGLGGNQDSSLMQGGGPLETSKMEDVRILRMHENEISRSIMSLQQVAAATVHIAPPVDSAFADSKHDATASVMVTLKSGQQLSDENVRAIVRITQFSTPGLSDKGIVVADSRGNALWDPGNSEDAGTGNRIKEQHNIAQNWESKIQRMLDLTIGPHKTTVAVNAELDPVHKDVTSKEVTSGAVLSKTETEEDLNGPGQANRGAPGATANLAGAAPGAGTPTYNTTNVTGDKGTYKRIETSSTSEPTITETVSHMGEGRIDKLTVSAFVDTSVPADEVSNIKQLMETMIGVNPNDATRSRMVTVQQVPFDHTEEDLEKKAAMAEQSSENTARFLSIAVPVGLLLLCFFLLARALRKPMRLATAGGQLALPGGGTMAYTPDGVPMALMADGTPAPGQTVGSVLGTDNEPIGLAIGSGPRTFDVIEEAFDSNLESILHLTKSKPETVAALIKSWISEDQG